MRAVAVRAFGQNPELMDLPASAPGAGEVLVRLAAAGVNPFDWKIIDGIFDGRRPHRFPLIVGIDGAGWVTELGPGVSRFRVGDPIVGQFLHDPVGIGTFAEFATVPESIGVSKFPPELSPVAAAALPTAGMTAVDALERLGLSAGSTLLVVGASGGVGSIATQLAASRGVRVVVVARASSATRLRSLGAAEFLEYVPDTLVERVRATYPSGVDAVLDLVSDRARFVEVASTVRQGGRAATTTFVADPVRTRPQGIESFNIDLQPSHILLDRLLTETIARHLSVPVERTVPLADAPAAITESRSGRASGKTVVVIP
jgi:NADPH:quinone reductase-like Zn-dependent oxidoreductase